MTLPGFAVFPAFVAVHADASRLKPLSMTPRGSSLRYSCGLKWRVEADVTYFASLSMTAGIQEKLG
jgi:hypothetical protein